MFQANLHILNVFEYVNNSPPESGGLLLDLSEFYKDAETSLDKLVQQALQSGARATGTVDQGLAHTSILDYVDNKSIDLVVIGTRAIHGLDRLFFGSTAEAVLRKASCPVLTTGPRVVESALSFEQREGCVLFATDFHASTTDALCYAAGFATKMQLALHCLNVLPRGADQGTHKGVIPQIITEGLQHLALPLAGTPTPPVCTVAYGSEISNAVVEYAGEHNVKLIVLGVRRASLLASHVPAHIAYRIITEAACPVLTMAYPLETGTRTTSARHHLESSRTAFVSDTKRGIPQARL